MSLKKSASSSPSLFNFNNELTSDPLKIANVFNNYFSSIGEKTQPKIRFSNKNYTDYLYDETYILFLLHLHTVKKLFPLYPYSVIVNILVQTVYQQEN